MLSWLKNRRQRKIDLLSAKIGDAKQALQETCLSIGKGSIEAVTFHKFLKNDIANWQRQIDKLKGKK